MYDLRRFFAAQYAVGRALVCGFCLVAFSLTASAGTDLVVGNPAYAAFRAQVSGNTAMLYYGSGGTLLPSASTLAQHASVAGLSPTAGEISRYGGFATKYGQVPIKVSQTLTAARIAKGIGAIAGGPLGIGLFALKATADWLADAGYRTNNGQLEAVDPATLPPADYDGKLRKTAWTVNSNSRADACSKYSAYKKASNPSFNWPVLTCASTYVTVRQVYTSGQDSGATDQASFTLTTDPNPPVPTYAPAPASGVEAALTSKARTTSEIEQILSETIKYPEVQPDPVEAARIDPPVAGQPIKSPTKQSTNNTTNPDGTTVEEVKSCWIAGTVNVGASMTMKEVCNTDTTVKGTSGTVISTSTSVTTAEEPATVQEEEKGFCESLVGKLVCSDLDTPEAEPIDKTTKTLTYAPENHFGGGACPADAVMTTHNGQSLKVWDWATSCDKINQFFRPLFLTLCAFTALMILAPAVKEA